MIQRGDGAGFSLKASHALRIVRHSRGQHLDGDIPAETRVSCAKNLSHTTSADRREDVIWAEFVACKQWHGVAHQVYFNRIHLRLAHREGSRADWIM